MENTTLASARYCEVTKLTSTQRKLALVCGHPRLVQQLKNQNKPSTFGAGVARHCPQPRSSAATASTSRAVHSHPRRRDHQQTDIGSGAGPESGVFECNKSEHNRQQPRTEVKPPRPTPQPPRKRPKRSAVVAIIARQQRSCTRA